MIWNLGTNHGFLLILHAIRTQKQFRSFTNLQVPYSPILSLFLSVQPSYK